MAAMSALSPASTGLPQAPTPDLRRCGLRASALVPLRPALSSGVVARATTVASGRLAVGEQRRDRAAWADREASKHRYDSAKAKRSSEQLLERLLDLDADDDATGDERLQSNALASSSGRSSWANNAVWRRVGPGPGAVPPGPEVLLGLLRQTEARRRLLRELDLSSPSAVSARVLLLSERLALAPEALAAMARSCGRLLRARPEALEAALGALADVVEAQMQAQAQAQGGKGQGRPGGRAGAPGAEPGGARGSAGGRPSDAGALGAAARAAGSAGPSGAAGAAPGPGGGAGAGGAAAVREAAEALSRVMATAAPQLLLLPPERLRRGGRELAAVLKARGVQVLPLLQGRPDLLLQGPASLAAKLDALPTALGGLPPRRVRELLAKCPGLLRRSPAQLSRRYRLLQQLFAVPPAFMAELVGQEPAVVGGFGAATLAAKFDSLAGRYGRFADDVADMILVDPSVLITALPVPPSAPGTGSGSGSGSGSASGSEEGGGRGSLSSLASLASMDAADADGADAAAAAAAVAAASGRRRRGGAKGASSPPAPPTPAPTSAVPVLDRVVALAGAAGIPLGSALRLVAADEAAAGLSGEEVAERLGALAEALGLGGAEVAAAAASAPGLLLLDRGALAGRLAAVGRLLLPPEGSATGGGPGVGSGGVRGVEEVLRAHPELLLQDPAELEGRLAVLCELLLAPGPGPGAEGGALSALAARPPPPLPQPLPARLLAAVGAQPGALLGGPRPYAPGGVAERLLVMQSLFEIPRALACELVFKEPGLLAAPLDSLEAGFRSLAASFGAFSADAIDVVLADPSLVLRAGEQSEAGPKPGAGRPSGSRSGSGGRGRGSGGSRGGSRSDSPAASAAAKRGRRRKADAKAPGAPAPQETEQGPGRGRRRRQSAVDAAGPAGEPAPASSEAAVPGGRRGGRQREGPPGAGAAATGREDLAATAAAAAAAGRSLDGPGPQGPTFPGPSGPAAGGELGALGAMSAADFDRLGEEGLPPPPPPSRRRRRPAPPQ